MPQRKSDPTPSAIKTMAERAQADFPEPHANPLRHDPQDDRVFHYSGWGMASGHTGHVVREWKDGAWSEPFVINAATLRRTLPAGLLAAGVPLPC